MPTRHRLSDGYATSDLYEGDIVWVRATVVRIETENVLVELFSKTDQYDTWVRPDLIEVELEDVTDEPADGAIVQGDSDDNGVSSIFKRDDAEGHNDKDRRRYDRHWWDYVAQEWIDWATALRRGANPQRRLFNSLPGAEAHRMTQRANSQQPPADHPGRFATRQRPHTVTAEILLAVDEFLRSKVQATTAEIVAGTNELLRGRKAGIEITAGQAEKALDKLRSEGRARPSETIGGVTTRWIKSDNYGADR